MKVTFKIVIDASVISEGNWGDECSLAQVMKQAYDETGQYQVFLKKGNGEPERAMAKIELHDLRIHLEGDERSRTRVPRQ